MKSESLGSSVNVMLRERDRKTGKILKVFKGHNIITYTGLQILADYISAHFNNTTKVLELSDNDIESNYIDIVNDYKALVSNLPYYVMIGRNATKESYHDTGLKSPIVYPSTAGDIAGKPVVLPLSGGSSTIQSAFVGSLQSLSVSGYENGITISYGALSRSDTFETFNTGPNGIIQDETGQTIKLNELALINNDMSKCWARIALVKDNGEEDGFVLNINRVYDVLWNINLVSIPTQLKYKNS